MNKVLLSGRIATDLVLKYLPKGGEVINFVVATDESYLKDGTKISESEFHNIVAYGKTAEAISTYLKKGFGIVITDARLKTRKYRHKEFPIDIYRTEIVLESFEFPIAPPKGSHENGPVPSQDRSFDRGDDPQ